MPSVSTFSRVTAAAAAIAAMMATAVIAQQQPALDPGQLTLNGVDASRVTYRGRDAVRLVERDGPAAAAATASAGLAVLRGVTLMDGTIELQVAGAPRTGAAEGARGFVGVAFRLSPDGSSFENLYLRPTNGRADDQVRRNHSVQYASEPDFPWPRLRKEFPEKYESYVDLEPGAWTRMRIVVRGATVRLYVHDAQQPMLVVNDLKLAPRDGGVALWIGPGTEGYFADLKITR
ncbi:MAG: hypothetical protein ABI818_10020 [Acidobacteriota bacterium]